MPQLYNIQTMTYDNKLLVQSFIFDALAEVGTIELSNDKLSFKNNNHNIEVLINPIRGVDAGDLIYLLQSLAK